MRRFLESWHVFVGTLIGVATVASWIWIFHGNALIYPDSATYLSYSWAVPLGYPLFLSAAQWVTGSVTFVPPIQVVLLASAIGFLAIGVGRAVESRCAGLVAAIAMLAHTPTFWLAGFVMTESLYTALLMVNVGAALSLIARHGRLNAVAVVASTVAAVFLRPSGYFAPAGMLYLLLTRVVSPVRFAIWFLIPFIILIAAVVTTNSYVRGTGKQSQVGRVLFGHVALDFKPSYAAQADSPLAVAAYDALKPFQDEYHSLEGWGERYRYSMNSYGRRLNAAEAEIMEVVQRGHGDQALTPAQTEDPQLRFFLATVVNAPIDYLRNILEQSYGAWWEAIFPWRRTTLGELQGEDETFDARIELWSRYNLPLEPEQARIDQERMSGIFAMPVALLDKVYSAYRDSALRTWVSWIVGAATLFAIPAAVVYRRSRHLLALGYLGVMIHGSVFLIAATTVFIPRYAIPVEPLILTGAVVAGHWLVKLATMALKRQRVAYGG